MKLADLFLDGCVAFILTLLVFGSIGWYFVSDLEIPVRYEKRD